VSRVENISLNISWHSNWMFFSSRLKIISSLFTYNWAVSNFSAHKLTSLWIENVSSSYIALMVVGKLNFLYLTVHLRILICNAIFYQDLFTRKCITGRILASLFKFMRVYSIYYNNKFHFWRSRLLSCKQIEKHSLLQN
jgi:hypothetical protein